MKISKWLENWHKVKNVAQMISELTNFSVGTKGGDLRQVAQQDGKIDLDKPSFF